VWNNWARENPSFVVAMLELQSYLSAQPGEDVPRSVGSPLELKLEAAAYEPQVRFATPKEESSPTATIEAEPAADGRLVAVLPSTDSSGIYQARLMRKDGKEEIRRWAVNVDPDEGDLRTLTYPELASRLEGVKHEYHLASSYQHASEQEAGYNLGTVLLYVLVLLLIAEQILSYAASYHPPSLQHGRAGGGAA